MDGSSIYNSPFSADDDDDDNITLGCYRFLSRSAPCSSLQSAFVILLLHGRTKVRRSGGFAGGDGVVGWMKEGWGKERLSREVRFKAHFPAPPVRAYNK